MATITVLKFDTPAGASEVLGAIQGLAKQELIKLHDAAIVTWEQGKKKPQTKQLQNMAGAGALGGAFWGMLFGLIFFIPILGMAIGAAMGALFGSMADVGIDDGFIKSVRSQVTEGTSALFLMTSDAVQDRVVDDLKKYKFQIISTNLSKAQEDALRAAFAEEQG